MESLILEPYALQQRWTLAEPAPPAGWARLFADFLETVARRCAASGSSVIGHIKALALVPPGGYVRLSVLAAGRPAEVDLSEGAAAAALTLTLNAHVYGLKAAIVAGCVEGAAAEVSARWGARVRLVLPAGVAQPASTPT